VTTRIRILILLLSAMVCLAIVTSSGSAYNHYAIHYGRHGWGPPEVAFLLHYLLFGATAVVLLGAALDLAMGRHLTDAFDRLATLSARSAWSLTALASVLVFGLVTLSRYGLLGDTAITDDENVYTFMARTFASGRLYLESMPEPVRPFFNNQFIINDGKWYGIYFPGHPALLALGERFHLMHWVPTVSATLTVPLTFAVGRRVFGQRAALLALPLLALSPFFILSSATLLGHSTAGLLLMTFLYSTVRVLERPERMVWWLAAGIALACTGLTRPVSAAAFALPWLVLLALSLRRSLGHRPWAPATLFCLIGVGSAAVLGAYHMALSGNPLASGYHTFGRITGMSFTQGALLAPAPYPSLFELGSTLARLNFWLLGWPVSLAFLPFFRRTREGVALLLAPVGVVLLFAITTVPSINVVGPVHYAELIAPLVLLSASGIEELAQWVRTRLNASAGRVLALPIAATLCALVLYVPLYAGSLGAMARVARTPYDLVETARLDHAVVFVRSLGALEFPPGSWAYYPRNPSPDLTDPVLYVRDLGEPRNRDLIRLMPDRKPFWLGVRDGQLVLAPVAP
jgi:hypothetical protein